MTNPDDHMTRHHRKPQDRTAAQRMRDLRAREDAHQRRPTITVGPDVTTVQVELGMLSKDDLENNQRLGKACEEALKMWAEDRAKWLERHFVTRNTAGRRDRL